MSNMLKWAEAELKLAGYDINDPEDGPNRWLGQKLVLMYGRTNVIV
jgi:hypothetical protein